MLAPAHPRLGEAVFIAILFLAIRPVAVFAGLLGERAAPAERGLLAWFGIRGIGSVYYLMYAVNHGLAPALAGKLISTTLTVIAVSIVVHGITVTPLMNVYRARRKRPPKFSAC